MLYNMLKILRINQWLKNLLLYFPPFLGGTFFSVCLVPRALLPFVSFCLASSFVYILNDFFDKENDRHHPEKRTRPIASGQISVTAVASITVVLLTFSLIIALNISNMFFLIITLYFVVSIAYSVRFKEIVLVDIFCISAGFLVRLLAGGAAFNIVISELLFLSVFLLSIFLSAGKRLAEKQRLGEAAHYHRKALTSYPKGFLEGIMYITGSSVLVTYTMYVISRHSSLLLYSVPLCCFGLLRYLLRVQSGLSGDPTDSLLRDLPLLIVGAAWVGMVGWGIYGP